MNKNGITGLHEIFLTRITGLKDPIRSPGIIYRRLRVSAPQASFWLAH